MSENSGNVYLKVRLDLDKISADIMILNRLLESIGQTVNIKDL